MADASDIITFIGVPLAVLGVLPIFYTFINSFFTLRNVRQALRRCGLDATTRGSFMAGVIEVSLPRYSVTPLDREEDEYWRQGTIQSTLKGGSWTTFNWNRLITGHAMQRIQYSSDLKLPQAEVDLDELFEYLLDRGAVPDARGIHMLRVSGLWTPTGTSLMLSPDSSQAALRVSTTDDSDGILSLALQWKSDWTKRNSSSLPPGWIRLDLQTPSPSREDKSLSQVDRENGLDSKKPVDTNGDGTKMFRLEKAKRSHDGLPAYVPSPTSLRFQLAGLSSPPYVHIISPFYEFSHSPVSLAPASLPNPMHQSTHWLAPLALTLALSYESPTTFLTLPSSLQALAVASSIPCGVLVLLHLLSHNDAPEWETPVPLPETHAFHERFMAQTRAMNREKFMPEAERQAAQRLRQQEEVAAMNTRVTRELRERREREDKREQEAISSQRLDVGIVRVAALAYLMEAGQMDPRLNFNEKDEQGKTAHQAALGRLIMAMYNSSAGIADKPQGWALDVCSMLDRWQGWTERGGMNKDDLRAVLDDKAAFCWAAVAVGLVSTVHEKEKAEGGSLLGDVRECLRVWKKVRLG
ncbi:MAG: hypothetical protein Q9174_005425 [Haloplaca sp. 1 TL-2023]